MITLHKIGRFFYITRKAIELRSKYKQSYDPANKQESLRRIAVEIRETFEDLGPTFIKLGQMLSLRVDFLPMEICIELRKLLDNDPQISYQEAKQIVESELKKPLSRLFKSFNQKPISAASLAQVHKAVLKNGKKVAVKIQRPHIKKQIDEDIGILLTIAKIASVHPDISELNPAGVIEEFREWTKRELNYVNEGNSADKFRKNFEGTPFVKVPKVYWDYTTENVITYEFIDGISLNDVVDAIERKDKKIFSVLRKNHINLKTFISRTAEVIFKQTLEDRFFHADPHPANIILLPDNKIAFLDFGIMGHLTPLQKSQIFLLMLALVEGDADTLFDISLKLTQQTPTSNLPLLKKKINELLEEWEGTTLKEISMAQWFSKFAHVVTECNLRLPAQFTLMVKQLATLDGIALVVDPDFSMSEEIKPFLYKMLKEEFSEQISTRKLVQIFSSLLKFVEELPEDLTTILRKIKEGEITLATHEEAKEDKLVSNLIKIAVFFVLLFILFAVISNLK